MISSCANVVTPQGGQKDISPPEALIYRPLNMSTNFNTSTIEIEFNEYVQTSDLFNEVVISPPMTEIPTFKVRGKRLIIKLNEDLKPSTTYTINFGSGIKDITESNAIDNFSYVFSTGEVLDTLSISGTIQNLVTGEPADGAIAVLYFSQSDTAFTSEKPYYFAKTNKTGNFSIKNIKEGTYQLFGLVDQNFNYFYDLPNELIGFSDTLIRIDSVTKNYDILIFQEYNTALQLLEAKSFDFGSSRIAFSTDASQTKIEFINETQYNPIYIWSPQFDTLFAWNQDTTLSHHDFQIFLPDKDTLLSIELKEIPSAAEFAKLRSNFKTNLPGTTKSSNSYENPYLFDLDQSVNLIFNRPIAALNKEFIQIWEDSISLNNIAVQQDTNDLRLAQIQFPVKPETNYKVIIAKSAFTDIFNLVNDSAIFYLRSKKIEDYGNLKITVENITESKILIELLRGESLIRKKTELTHSGVINYLILKPDIYQIRAIIDLNNNGKWDTGNLKEKQQPEPILYYQENIQIRGNWDLEINWVVSN